MYAYLQRNHTKLIKHKHTLSICSVFLVYDSITIYHLTSTSVSSKSLDCIHIYIYAVISPIYTWYLPWTREAWIITTSLDSMEPPSIAWAWISPTKNMGCLETAVKIRGKIWGLPGLPWISHNPWFSGKLLPQISKWKGNDPIGDTPMFHWTMMMGGRVLHSGKLT